jgi:hypothetical protein
MWDLWWTKWHWSIYLSSGAGAIEEKAEKYGEVPMKGILIGTHHKDCC